MICYGLHPVHFCPIRLLVGCLVFNQKKRVRFSHGVLSVDINCMKNVVLAIPVKNCGKYIDNLMHQIAMLDYPRENISIAIVENDSDDDTWARVQRFADQERLSDYREVSIEKRDTGFKLPHHSRHVEEIQQERLNVLANMRQYMVDAYLRDNDYLWWIDADCIFIPQNALKELLRPEHDIVVPILVMPGGSLYDHTTIRFEVDGGASKVPDLVAENPDADFIRVDLANAPFLASSKAFKLARYECEAMDQEGPCFCRQAAKHGIFPYAAVNVHIIHAPSYGRVPLNDASRS